MGNGQVRPDRGVFLDRDGVINQAIVRGGHPYAPRRAEEVKLIPGVAVHLNTLKDLGFYLIVVTNQPELARGNQDPEELERMHSALRLELPIDDILVCGHDDQDGCRCRKPKPGLLLEGAARYGLQLKRSYLIGDRWRDIDAGNAAGVCSILIDYGYDERKPETAPAVVVGCLREAVEWIAVREEGRKLLI